MIGLILALSAANLAADTPQITVSKPQRFSCDVRNSEGKSFSFSGRFENWSKHELNDSGNIHISSGSDEIPAGSFVAVADGHDVTFSNYLSNSTTPARMAIVIGDTGNATVTVEVKAYQESAAGTHLFAGFCTGHFAGIGAV